MDVTKAKPFTVGSWLIEPELLQISKGEEIRKIELRTMEILLLLASNEGKVVSKQELHDEIWGDIYVTDNALTRAVSRLRKAFDDDPLQPQYIDTISKTGYRIIATIDFDGDQKRSYPRLQGKKGRAIVSLILGALLLVTGFGLVTYWDKDIYSGFYDPSPVSTLIGPEVEPEISPDGEHILFSYVEPGATYSNIYIKMLGDLSQVNFTNRDSHQGFGSWSPDGAYVAYASTEAGDCGIFKEPSIGGENTRIGTCYSNPRDFGWTTDGSKVVFTDIKSAQEPRKIFFIDVATNSLTEVTSPGQGVQGDYDPEFTPDGKFMLFNRKKSGLRGDLFKMNLETNEITQLTFDNAAILGLDVFDNGERVAFSSNRGGQRALWSIPISGGETTRFKINDRVPTHPRFATERNRMIYKSNIDQTHLWISEKDSAIREVAASSRAETHPSISSDGKKLVFISNRTGNFEIWTSALSGINAVKYTSLEGSFVNMPSWSPNDSEIVFDGRVGEDNAIFIIDVASKTTRTFIDLEGDQVNARYSRDGKWIYFSSNHSGNWQVWKKSVIDETLVQVTENGGYYLQEGLIDNFLYYTKNDTSGIWKISTSGNQEEEQVVSGLSQIDWGSWTLTDSGFVFLQRANGTQVVKQLYDEPNAEPITLYKPDKPVQIGSPTLSVTPDGSTFILAQIINREDEIMLVDFDK
ncbi:MAG: winged helix-turn-helix domain-containing protein [Balneolaceae bacterium]